MKIRELRWYIMGCIILLITFTTLSMCLYLPVKGKIVTSIQELSKENLVMNLDFAEEAINNYYNQFINGNYQSIETDFNKTGYIDKMAGNKYVIKEGKDFLNIEGDNSLYVFFYNDAPNMEIGGYIPLTKVLEFTNQQVVIFSSTGAIKYNTVTQEPIGTMSGLVKNESFMSFVSREEIHTGSYNVSGKDGVVAVGVLYDYYFATYISLEDAMLSIDWILNQTLVFIVMGILFIAGMLGLMILGCYKATLLIRIDRRTSRTPNAIILHLNKQGKVLYSNPAFKRLEYELEKIHIDDFLEINTDKKIRDFFKEKRTIQCYLDKCDKITYFQFTPIYFRSTYYLIGSDISIEYNRLQQLEEVNGRHAITGCYNRFALRNRFETVMSNMDLDVAFIEFRLLDHFDIMELFGYQAYEELLNEIIFMLKEKYPGMEIYHITDEQMIILYPNVDIDDVLDSVNEMMEIFKRPITINTNNIYVKFKAVITNVKQEEFDSITTIEIGRRNDAAYHTIKDFLEKDVAIYEPYMDGVVLAEKQLEEDLKIAIFNNELVQYLQPQYSLSENRIVGFESLLRWNNPKYFDKPIQQVVELAEQKGYMLDMAKIIINNTFELARNLEKYNVTISLNLSPIQIIQAGFVSELIAKFEEFGLKEGSIALEITETFLMKNFILVNEKLKILKRAGFKIHLDDFCTGYSSMKYLKDLPVDSIKIDQEFIKHVNTNKVNKSIVSCITELAKELNLEVIAEGVENTSQRDAIKKIGCKIIQGYLIGKALPYEQVINLLEKKK